MPGVKDPVTEEPLSVADATHAGILDVHAATYRTETGDKLSLHDAIASGLLEVQYHEDPKHPPVEVVSKTYAVHGVVDQKKKAKVRD